MKRRGRKEKGQESEDNGTRTEKTSTFFYGNAKKNLKARLRSELIKACGRLSRCKKKEQDRKGEEGKRADREAKENTNENDIRELQPILQ